MESSSESMSKNAQKRARKQAEWESKKNERKMFLKAKEKEKKANKPPKNHDQSPKKDIISSGIQLVIDLSFNHLMLPKELSSTA